MAFFEFFVDSVEVSRPKEFINLRNGEVQESLTACVSICMLVS